MKGGTITEDDPSKPRRTVISTMILILENMRFTFLLTITLFMVICIYIIYTIKEIVLPDVILFEWDDGNSTKSWVKHKVSIKEQEEAFFDKNKRAFEDEKHSTIEQRF